MLSRRSGAAGTAGRLRQAGRPAPAGRNLNRGQKAANWLLGVSIGHGYRPELALLGLVAAFLITLTVVSVGGRQRRLHPRARHRVDRDHHPGTGYGRCSRRVNDAGRQAGEQRVPRCLSLPGPGRLRRRDDPASSTCGNSTSGSPSPPKTTPGFCATGYGWRPCWAGPAPPSSSSPSPARRAHPVPAANQSGRRGPAHGRAAPGRIHPPARPRRPRVTVGPRQLRLRALASSPATGSSRSQC